MNGRTKEGLAAAAYLSAHIGRSVTLEFERHVELDGHKILVVGISVSRDAGDTVPGFPNQPRVYRVETFIDGKHRGGMIVSQ